MPTPKAIMTSAVLFTIASSGARVGAAGAPQQLAQVAADISPEALAQIDALIREKDSRTPVQQKIDSQLLYELKMESGRPIADGIFAVETDLLVKNGHAAVAVAYSVASLGGGILAVWAGIWTARAVRLLERGGRR